MPLANSPASPLTSLADVKGRPVSMYLGSPGVSPGLLERRDLPRREALVRRITAEFEELPGLSLSLRQAMKLLGVDEAACLRILDHLSRIGHIRRDARHLYVRRERVL
jgi:hypothetical protein